jgi:hypothetical protein
VQLALLAGLRDQRLHPLARHVALELGEHGRKRGGNEPQRALGFRAV